MTIQIHPGSPYVAIIASPDSRGQKVHGRLDFDSTVDGGKPPYLSCTVTNFLSSIDHVESGGMILQQNHHCFRFVFSCQETHEPVFAAPMLKVAETCCKTSQLKD